MTTHSVPWIEALESRLLLSTITVTTFSDVVNASDGLTSLREAVLAANADPGDNDIVLVAGTYTLSIPNVGGVHENAGATGDLDINSPGGGMTTLRGVGAGSTFINANHLDRVLDIFGDSTVTLDMLTIENGLAQNSAGSGSAMGGGISVSNSSSLTLDSVTLLNNEAKDVTGAGALGGGIYTYMSTVRSTDSTFQGNQAVGANGAAGGVGLAGGDGSPAVGGGIYVANGTASFSNDMFSTNTVTGGNGGNGGAGASGIGLAGGAGGSGAHASGGALAGGGGDITLDGCTFSGDTATGGNGGLGGDGGSGLSIGGFFPGGSGGNGGQGGAGGQGFAGSIYLISMGSVVLGNWGFTATPISAGGNGGNGGTGGNGGAGIPTGPGGDGGDGGANGGATCPEYYISTDALTNYGLTELSRSAIGGAPGTGGPGGTGLTAGASGAAGSGSPLDANNQLLNAIPVGTISGMAWDDTNGNGIQDAGEQPLSGVEVGVSFGSLPQVYEYTASNGAYSFTGPSGPATVEVFPAANYSLSPQTGSYPSPITGLTGAITVPVTGTASNINIGMYNAIQYSGTIVDITGNDLISDQFTLAIQPGSFAVGLNDMRETIPSTYNTINFHGLGGTDSITITGGSAAEMVNFTGIGGTISASGYTINLDSMESQRFIGQANDIGTLTAASATDTFTGRPTYSFMAGGGYNNRIDGSASVTATAFGGANSNAALLYDSAGNDTFYATPTYAYLQGTGFNNRVNGFSAVDASAIAGGTDKAYLYDSTGNDTFYSTATYSYLKGTGFYNYARGFGSVYAYASTGTDSAYLYDTAGNDAFVGNTTSGGLTSSYMSGGGLMHRATGFDNVYAYASTGTDTAYLYDTAGNDAFVGNTISGGKTSSYMSGSGLMDRATGFDKVYAYATKGTDTAYVYGTSGADQFHARSNWGQLTQWPTSPTSYFVYFSGFDSLTVNSSTGSDGHDVSGLLYPVTYLSTSHWIARAG